MSCVLKYCIAALVVILAGCSDSPEQKLAKMCGPSNGGMAYAMAQRQVESRLKAPSSARFASYGSEAHAIPDGNCGFVVSGFVDSQNSFGAMLRNHFVAKLKYNIDTDRWHLVDLSM